MSKIFVFGTDEPTLTVHVPTDCANACSFCVNKRMYHTSEFKNSLYTDHGKWDIVKETLKDLLGKYPEMCRNIVISGGEPLVDYERLKSNIFPILAEYKNKKVIEKVYLNTYLPNIDTFIDMCINYASGPNRLIDGISVSRPNLSVKDFNNYPYGDENKDILFKVMNEFKANFAYDHDMPSIRINSIMKHNNPNLKNIVTMYKNAGIKVSLREDFSKENNTTIHKLTEEQKIRYNDLDPNFVGGCNSCATFATNIINVTIHKGLEHTSHQLDIGKNTLVEVVDFIIDPVGNVYYDWISTESDKDLYRFDYKTNGVDHIHSREGSVISIFDTAGCRVKVSDEEEEQNKKEIINKMIHNIKYSSDPSTCECEACKKTQEKWDETVKAIEESKKHGYLSLFNNHGYDGPMVSCGPTNFC